MTNEELVARSVVLARKLLDGIRQDGTEDQDLVVRAKAILRRTEIAAELTESERHDVLGI